MSDVLNRIAELGVVPVVAIDAALGRLQPGDLCLVLVDQVEEALAHLQKRVSEPPLH